MPVEECIGDVHVDAYVVQKEEHVVLINNGAENEFYEDNCKEGGEYEWDRLVSK